MLRVVRGGERLSPSDVPGVGSPVTTAGGCELLGVCVERQGKGLCVLLAEERDARACRACPQTNLLKRRWSLAAAGLGRARAAYQHRELPNFQFSSYRRDSPRLSN